MANRLLLVCARQNIPTRAMSSVVVSALDKIGNRDVVGYGYNGEPAYIDRHDFPMPAIRFKENTPDIMALREKEKGDWKKLSIDEKKALYRASFCQTFAELDVPSTDWKANIGVALLGVAFSLWIFMFFKAFIYPPLPKSFDEEHRTAQMERMKKLHINPITGIGSQQ